MQRFHRLALLAAVAAAPLASQAAPITYDFTVSVTSGPQAGTSVSGSFSYDSGIVVPGGSQTGALLTDLSFSFDGVSFDETTANSAGLGFDAAGNLDSFLIGNSCAAGSCGVFAPGDWAVFVRPDLSFFGYQNRVGGSGDASGTATFALHPVNTALPEPASLALAGLALAALGGAGGRRPSRLADRRSPR